MRCIKDYLTFASLAAATATTTANSTLLPNIVAHFGPSPLPFNISVDDTFVEDVHHRVALARAPIPLHDLQTSDEDGPTVEFFHTLQTFWRDQYNWTETESRINKELMQYTTTVRSSTSNYTHPVPLHFVHHRSPRADAVPFLFIHGWPGSFLEISNIIERLTNPPNASLPAFHVVAPSIPGFGFSPAPITVGYGPREAGHTFNSLMVQLGYPKYVVNGGDFGGIILRYQAHDFPENVLAVLCNFWLVEPSAADNARFLANKTTADESEYITRLNTFVTKQSGYRFIQQTLPLTLAYSMTDSPLGFAMWIWSLMSGGYDPNDFAFTPQDIITWAMMYIIQGPYGASRFYKESQREGAFSEFSVGKFPYVSVPTAISEFPYDIWYGLPLEWARRSGNVKKRYIHSRGGHFAAYEVPELLAGDIWDFFGSLNV